MKKYMKKNHWSDDNTTDFRPVLCGANADSVNSFFLVTCKKCLKIREIRRAKKIKQIKQ